MKHFFQFLITAALITLSSCTNTSFDYGLGDYRIDFVTLMESPTGRYYVLDNQTKLLPKTLISADFKTGSRVLLNYNVLEQVEAKSYMISMNSASLINSSTIKTLTSAIADDPLRIESVWISGDWLNLRLSYEYFSKQHSLDLFQKTTPKNDTLYLELHHAKNGDPAGYWVRTLSSYSLKSFAKTTAVPIKLRVKTTNEGVKNYFFNYAGSN